MVNDPATGLVPPGRFIPILEETGLIHEVGRWAVHKAIEDYLNWTRAGLAAVRVAVNVSPQQLRHRDFVADIKLAVGIDPAAAAGLELEITESMVMQDFKHNIVSLHAIRAMGLCIAIDDFGTGFSSLSYLAKLPVDTLKIDRSFIVDMEGGREGSALVATIISLAHALKLKVVAEGVETAEQLRLISLLHCDEYQGFLFGKPVPVDIFTARYLVPRDPAARPQRQPRPRGSSSAPAPQAVHQDVDESPRARFPARVGISITYPAQRTQQVGRIDILAHIAAADGTLHEYGDRAGDQFGGTGIRRGIAAYCGAESDGAIIRLVAIKFTNKCIH